MVGQALGTGWLSCHSWDTRTASACGNPHGSSRCSKFVDYTMFVLVCFSFLLLICWWSFRDIPCVSTCKMLFDHEMRTVLTNPAMVRFSILRQAMPMGPTCTRRIELPGRQRMQRQWRDVSASTRPPRKGMAAAWLGICSRLKPTNGRQVASLLWMTVVLR